MQQISAKYCLGINVPARLCVSAALVVSASAHADYAASALGTVTNISIGGDYTVLGPQVAATFATGFYGGPPESVALSTQDIGSSATGSNTAPISTIPGGPPDNLFVFLAYPTVNAARADAQDLPGNSAGDVGRATFIAEAGAVTGRATSATGAYVESRGIQMNSPGPLTLSFTASFAFNLSTSFQDSVFANVTNVLQIAEASLVGQLPSIPDYRLGFPSSLPLVFSDSRTFGCSVQGGNCSGSGVENVLFTTPSLVAGRNYVVQLYSTAAVVAAPVPEPETYAMLLAGLAAIGIINRRRKVRDRSSAPFTA